MLLGICADTLDHVEHIRKAVQLGQTLSVNPGTINGFGEKATVALYDTTTRNLQFKTLKSK